jgi:hypothetical protein
VKDNSLAEPVAPERCPKQLNLDVSSTGVTDESRSIFENSQSNKVLGRVALYAVNPFCEFERSLDATEVCGNNIFYHEGC